MPSGFSAMDVPSSKASTQIYSLHSVCILAVSISTRAHPLSSITSAVGCVSRWAAAAAAGRFPGLILQADLSHPSHAEPYTCCSAPSSPQYSSSWCSISVCILPGRHMAQAVLSCCACLHLIPVVMQREPDVSSAPCLLKTVPSLFSCRLRLFSPFPFHNALR